MFPFSKKHSNERPNPIPSPRRIGEIRIEGELPSTIEPSVHRARHAFVEADTYQAALDTLDEAIDGDAQWHLGAINDLMERFGNTLKDPHQFVELESIIKHYAIRLGEDCLRIEETYNNYPTVHDVHLLGRSFDNTAKDAIVGGLLARAIDRLPPYEANDPSYAYALKIANESEQSFESALKDVRKEIDDPLDKKWIGIPVYRPGMGDEPDWDLVVDDKFTKVDKKFTEVK